VSAVTTRLAVLVVVVAWGLTACTPTGGGSQTTPTFARDVAPIVLQHCSPCHRPGEAGPFNLLTYDDARRRARQLAEVVGKRVMPPWMPEPGHGSFVGERRLTEQQIATIQRWVEAGTPEGDPKELPPPPTWTEGWSLGKPDLVVDAFPSYTMVAEGPDTFRTFVVPVPTNVRRYVRAVEIRPGRSRSVHHAMLRIVQGAAVPKASAIWGEDDGDGMLIAEASTASPDGHVIGWAPGYSPTVSPPDMPWILEPGTAFALELHLQATGKPEDVRPVVGLFFTDRPPTRTPLGLQLGNYAIDIPPGASDYTVEDRFVVPVDVEVQAIYPHAHYLGKDLRAWAILPGGSEQSLIWIRSWDFNWQNAYRYTAPVVLPRGSTIVMRYVYDNSAANARNPSDPPRRVRYGGRSIDEMGNLWLQVVPRQESDLPTLRADYLLKSTERQIAGFEHLLGERPGDARLQRMLADAHNRIGVTRHQLGQADEAARAYRRALAVWPSHATAHANLGALLREQGRPTEALQEYRAAIAADPAHTNAHFNLGLLLQQRRQWTEAMHHFRQAMASDPQAPDPPNALAWLLVTDPGATPDMRREGLELAERAVQRSAERDASAIDTLAAAYAAGGQFDRAVAAAERAWRLASASGNRYLADEIQTRLALYRTKKPYRR